jgi:hypothetical protein
MSMALAMHLVVSLLLGGSLDAKLPSWFAGFRRLSRLTKIISRVPTLSRQELVIGLCYPNPSPTAPTSKKYRLSLILALSLFKTRWLARGGEHGSEPFLQRGVIWTQLLGMARCRLQQ